MYVLFKLIIQVLNVIMFLILLNSTLSANNENKKDTTRIDITIHNRVDTSNIEVREILDLWINYLNSTPDIIKDNPHWNEEEKSKYTDFDFSRRFLYQFSSKHLLNYYKPTILSIEKENNYYSIRTIFFADNLDGVYRNSNPWCITKLYAKRHLICKERRIKMAYITSHYQQI